jgi:hypothetical protein
VRGSDERSDGKRHDVEGGYNAGKRSILGSRAGNLSINLSDGINPGKRAMMSTSPSSTDPGDHRICHRKGVRRFYFLLLYSLLCCLILTLLFCHFFFSYSSLHSISYSLSLSLLLNHQISLSHKQMKSKG